MTANWPEQAEALLDRLGYGMDALWALLYAAQHAAYILALDEPASDDSLVRVGGHLADALGEVEWARPELTRHGITLDLRPDPSTDPAVRREQLGAVLSVAVRLTRGLAADAGDETLDTTDLLALGRVASLIHAAGGELGAVRSA